MVNVLGDAFGASIVDHFNERELSQLTLVSSGSKEKTIFEPEEKNENIEPNTQISDHLLHFNSLTKIHDAK